MAARGRPRAFDRDAALNAAMDVFWRKGFTATSLNELCAVMGINAPSLYAAFGSKEKLYGEAISRYAQVASPLIWGHMEAAPSAREAVERMLMASAAALPGDSTPAGCMVTLSSVGQEGEIQLGKLVAEARAVGCQMVADRLRRGVEEGELPASLDVEGVARFYTCVQHGMSIQARDGANREALEAISRAAISAWTVLTSGMAMDSTGTAPAPPAPPPQ